MKIILLALLIACVGCSCIKYKSDAGLVSSALANVDIFPVKINNQFCKDQQNITGLCAFSIGRNIDLVIKIIPLPYNYDISLDCTNALGFDVSENGIKEHEKIITIAKDLYENINETFYCKGEIYREGVKPASVSFRFIVVLRSSADKYVKLPKPVKDKKNIVLGQHAFKTTCCANNICKFYSKKTIIKDKNFNFCYVESEAGRGSMYVKTN